jgi:hypothetical protein
MKFRISLLLLLVPVFAYAQSTQTPQQILKKALDNAKKSEEIANRIGFYQDVITRELDDDGKVTDQETRTFRTSWIDDTPYPELLLVDGKPPNNKQKDEEAKRRKKFVESLHENKKDDDEAQGSFTWEELSQKYKFTLLPSEPDAFYVMTFTPLNDDMQERNRVERVVNHLHGKIWLDENCNLLKAQAELTEPVKYGFGILGKIDELMLTYAQQKYEDLFVPVAFHAKFKARILVKNQQKEIDGKFYDLFQRQKASSGSH